jgi:hypothetical protein
MRVGVARLIGAGALRALCAGASAAKYRPASVASVFDAPRFLITVARRCSGARSHPLCGSCRSSLPRDIRQRFTSRHRVDLRSRVGTAASGAGCPAIAVAGDASTGSAALAVSGGIARSQGGWRHRQIMNTALGAAHRHHGCCYRAGLGGRLSSTRSQARSRSMARRMVPSDTPCCSARSFVGGSEVCSGAGRTRWQRRASP